jgi:tRNA(His) 5'-end guanylyltransferase
MQEMIFQKGQNWNDVPDGFKRGRTIATGPMTGKWEIQPLDFLKERWVLSQFIPKINESLT